MIFITRPLHRLVAFFAIATAALTPQQVLADPCADGSTTNVADGMVAADHPLAAEAGAQMLRQGGNAVDAAVATSMALSVVRTDACGIGGGGFMVIHLVDDPRHGTVSVAINYREACPAGIGPETYAELNDPEASSRGGLAVAVPGTVAGLLYALETYGTLDRQTVLEPAIRLANEGFEADDHHVRSAKSLQNRFKTRADWRDRFPLVWNRLSNQGSIEIGDQIRLPEQAAALKLIAEHGADGFYRGAIADAIVASVKNDNGVITHDDLTSYRISVSEPIIFELSQGRILSMPPPSSGGVAIAQMLYLAEQLDIQVTPTGWLDTASTHLLTESMKHAFADRSRYMSDPAFNIVPVDQMLDREALRATEISIDPKKTLESSDYGIANALVDDGGTSHISVIDSNGSAVACTETINLAFGSLVGVDGFGFCLNDQMDDFTTVAGQANAFGLVQSNDNLPEPGKRPLSSMSPTIVLDEEGRVVAVAGASGGPRIISSTTQVLLRIIMGGANATQAVEAPRVHHQWNPNLLRYETSGPNNEPPTEWRTALKSLGHELKTVATIGAVQAITRDPESGVIDGAADSRKGGLAIRVSK
jgi:gamma-glutamyltranspeptidase/glutathione hydrolase